MELHLNRDTKIREVKNQFAALFPFLKLEFFRYQHGKGESSVLADKVPDNTLLREAAPQLKSGNFVFLPTDAVADIEQRLQQEYGLPVQVFRKAGNLWLETVQTDNLSLEKQNSMGEDSAKPVRFNLYTLFL
jgi:hypothetical protein